MSDSESGFPRRMQDLPPAGARLCLEVGRFADEACGGLPRHAVVAFSGGADSTALALLLRCLGVPLMLAHLDHQLRPESAEEAVAAAAFADRLGVPCAVRRVDVGALARAGGLGLEDAGRRARYAFFEDLRRAEGWIVTGHHLDDLSEDVLLRLVRGAGWPGLGGMKAMDPVRRLMRPLLGTPRAALEAFLRSLGVAWIEDASNRSDTFRRNRLRNHVLPLLRAENPSLSRSVRTLWELAREDERYWDAELSSVFAQLRREGGALILPRAAFIGLPRAARLRVYAGLFSRFGRGQAQAETLFRLDEAALASRSRRLFQFPGAVCIETSGGGLRVGGREDWGREGGPF